MSTYILYVLYRHHRNQLLLYLYLTIKKILLYSLFYDPLLQHSHTFVIDIFVWFHEFIINDLYIIHKYCHTHEGGGVLLYTTWY